MTPPSVPFVRPLYPPSSPHKSEAGPDVESYKRAVSRAGFWPWQKFDQDYSEAFAQKGVRKFQSRRGLEADGNIGPKTLAALVASKVPAGDPDAGAYVFDATAVSLMRRAKALHSTSPSEEKAAKLLAFCGRFDGPYVWGGEHDNSFADDTVHSGFDCSSSCSFALHSVGLYPDTVAHVSGWFESYGLGGRGKYVTVHAASDHVWIEFTIPGYPWARFDTSPHGDGPPGPRVRTLRRSDSRFVHRHPRGY